MNAKEKQEGPETGRARRPEVDKLTFEQALDELEALVVRLEEGRFSLDQATRAYARGVALRGRCDSLLKAARLEVEKLQTDQKKETSEGEVLPA